MNVHESHTFTPEAVDRIASILASIWENCEVIRGCAASMISGDAVAHNAVIVREFAELTGYLTDQALALAGDIPERTAEEWLLSPRAHGWPREEAAEVPA